VQVLGGVFRDLLTVSRGFSFGRPDQLIESKDFKPKSFRRDILAISRFSKSLIPDILWHFGIQPPHGIYQAPKG
jgi:hypothetical protein